MGQAIGPLELGHQGWRQAGPGRGAGARHPGGRGVGNPQEQGFVLLLGFMGGLVLLLSSLGLQTLALQSRRSEALLLQRRQREDRLVSAVQLVAARLQRHPCLLLLPLGDWESAAAALCSNAADRQALLAGRLPAPDGELGQYRLLRYLPAFGAAASLEGADLTLEWRLPGGGSQRRSFRLQLQPAAAPLAPPLLRGVRT
ncbi:MAG: hypothetical protein ACKO7Z_03240 [Cyanobacteriota bacterium]